MDQGLRLTALASSCLLAVLAAHPARAQDGARTGPPSSIAAAGDSMTTAALSGELAAEVWKHSWVTGDSPEVQSHYLRLLAANPAVQGRVLNAAVSGQRMRHLEAQAQRVVAAQPDYVVLLMGANDACAGAEEEMTPVEDFRAQLEPALATLSRGLPDARLYVVSIPDVSRLWALFRDNAAARFLWAILGHCQSMLANPLSLAPGDVARRERVRQRIRDYNRQLAEVCGQYLHCRYDGDALFSYAFTEEDVSNLDFFHPSAVGQRQLAAVSWEAGFDLSDTVAPTSSARAVSRPDGVELTLSASDDVAVAGIEYRDTPTTWRRYDGPLLRQAGETLTFRAVDVNGNVEAAQSLLVEVPPPPPPEEGAAPTDGAAPGAGAAPGEDAVADGPPVGCGCAGSPGGTAAWSLLLVLGPWLARWRTRRRTHRR